MKNRTKKVVALLLCLVFAFGVASIGAAALVTEGSKLNVTISGDTDTLLSGETVQLTAKVTVPEGSELADSGIELTWESLEPGIATVDGNGLVKGVNIGSTKIRCTVTNVEGDLAYSYYTIYTVRESNAILDHLDQHTLLGYKYSYKDDYFYTNNDNNWQHYFGFMNAFDIASPWLTMEYDYVRLHFDYEGRSWMIQLWKGQYGPIFYGSEIGLYYRDEPVAAEDINAFTHYKCATDPEMRLNMEQTLYWDEDNDGNYQYQFTVPYGKYWWATGFKPGHLWETEPADELRMYSTIELKDAEMADAVCAQLIKCGFEQTEGETPAKLDSFTRTGNTVNIKWQNISEAESTSVAKATLGTLFATGSFSAIFLLIGFLLLSFFATFFFLVVL